MSGIIITDILNSDHLAVTFSNLDPVGRREALQPVKKLALATVSKSRN
jgi:hypothetical protein